MIDLHSDTIYALWKDDGDSSLLHNDLSISKERLERAGVRGQCFALFTPMHDLVPRKYRDNSPWEVLISLHERFLKETGAASIPILQRAEDLRDGSLHAILTTEEGGAIEGDISRLRILKEWGVRIFGLTWNWENELGYPNSTDPAIMGMGLKEKGIEAVEECGALGMIIDVSHLSDGGFMDVARYAKGPFIATHSNARSVTDVTRNLTDGELRILADRGGVAGLNLCPAFLHDEKATVPEEAVSRIDDMVRHIMHIYRTAGEDVPAIGTDFDGIGGQLEIASHCQMHLLWDALGKAGLKASIIDKISYGNALRVFLEAEGRRV